MFFKMNYPNKNVKGYCSKDEGYYGGEYIYCVDIEKSECGYIKCKDCHYFKEK